MVTESYIVPAAPEWYALEVYGWKLGKPGFLPTPVVAWEVQVCRRDGEQGSCSRVAIPVCTETVPDDAPLLAPDGRIIISEEAIFDCEGEALEYLQEQRAANA